jgi:hypothetical protein
MRRARGMLIGVSNIYPPKSDEQIWTVAFHVAGEGVRGNLLVPLSQGVFNGENTLKVARNKLRVFCSNLADATAPFALTEHEVSALRLDYEPDPLRR